MRAPEAAVRDLLLLLLVPVIENGTPHGHVGDDGAASVLGQSEELFATLENPKIHVRKNYYSPSLSPPQHPRRR